MEQGQGWTVLQYSGQPSHDTAGVRQQACAQGRAGRAGSRLGSRRASAGRWVCWRWARRQGARGIRAGRVGRTRQACMRGALERGAQASDTAWASGALAGARARGRARGARQGAAAGAGACGVRGLGVAGRWARGLGAWAGQDCALGALDLIFKPVFRLSIFPESVNERCSL